MRSLLKESVGDSVGRAFHLLPFFLPASRATLSALRDSIIRRSFVWITGLSPLVTIAVWPVQSQVERNPRFEHLTAADGLPSSTVPCLIQDRTGYLWFGTFRGLARYDGYTILSYRPRQGDSTSITNAIIEALCEDSEGNIWIGHARGLDKLDRATETFSHYVLNPQQPLTHWSNHVLAVHEDRNGVLWIGTGDGLCTFDRTTETFAWLRHDNTDPNSLGHNSVNGFCEGTDGSFWIATGGGLERFDRAINKFVHYWHVPNNAYHNPPTLGHWVLSIFEDREGILWLGTDGGVVEFNRQTETFTQYRHDPANPASLANNTVVSICEDRSGNLWISTKAGLDVLDRKTRRFSHHVHDSHDPAGLSSDAVGRIMLEQSGTLWISTDGSGVNKLVQNKSYLKHYRRVLPVPTNQFASDLFWERHSEARFPEPKNPKSESNM